MADLSGDRSIFPKTGNEPPGRRPEHTAEKVAPPGSQVHVGWTLASRNKLKRTFLRLSSLHRKKTRKNG